MTCMPVSVHTFHQPLKTATPEMPSAVGFPLILPHCTAAYTLLMSDEQWGMVSSAYAQDHTETCGVRMAEIFQLMHNNPAEFNSSTTNKVKQWKGRVIFPLDIAAKEGADLIYGGKAIQSGNGLFIEPTIFDNVTPDMTIATDEIFGPVLGIMSVDSDAAAIALANDTSYGLQTSLFTSNVTNAHRFARALQAGTVSVNCYGEGDITTPFGGYKLSGFGGRDNGFSAHDQYTETKTIKNDLSEGSV